MSLVKLQSKDHRNLLDIIDKLREQGISRYVDLPQIIVVGDQSAGKSSVLEAISKMSFPTKDNLCTRFATELVLRRDMVKAIKISIIPAPDRTAEEKTRLSECNIKVDKKHPDLGQAVEKARELMGISDTKVFSADILRVELSGPTQPHLTMVDLPGIFRAGNKDQSVNDATTVRNLVCDYMRRPRSIILAVVSAKSDFALQEITELARELDPDGIRTLGLITKPDTLDSGSDSEQFFYNLARNVDVKFRLGWHVLKNRSYAEKDLSSELRDQEEEKFFSAGLWSTMDPKSVGVKSLVPRLSDVLKEQILLQLPSLIKDIRSGIKECELRLSQLGISRSSIHEQRRYLLHVSQDFTSLIKAAVDGFYNDAYFGSALSDEGYGKRLRATVQNLLLKFKDEMALKGHTHKIIEDNVEHEVTENDLSRSEYRNRVQLLMQRSRGCELPGTFNPLVIGELFADQCQPWKKLASQVKNAVMQAVYVMTQSAIRHVAVEETAYNILEIVGRSIEALKKNLELKVDEILDPHINGHPITYNHYLTDNIQKAQSARLEAQLEAMVKEFQVAGWDSPPPWDELLHHLKKDTQVDMEVYACDLAIDCMQAYYKAGRYT